MFERQTVYLCQTSSFNFDSAVLRGEISNKLAYKINPTRKGEGSKSGPPPDDAGVPVNSPFGGCWRIWHDLVFKFAQDEAAFQAEGDILVAGAAPRGGRVFAISRRKPRRRRLKNQPAPGGSCLEATIS